MPNEHEPVGNELIRAVELLADAFSSRSIRDAIVGVLATLVRGRPRFTQDVDVLSIIVIRHQNFSGRQALDRLEVAFGHLLAELGHRPQVAVGRAAAVEPAA